MKLKSLLFIIPFIGLFTNLIAKTPGEGWPSFKCKFTYITGTPNERGVCVGGGTCRVDFDCEFTWASPAPTNGSEVELTRNDAGNVIVTFPKASLNAQQTSDLFLNESGKFVLAYDTPLPTSTAASLHFPNGYTLRAGSYDIVETPNSYIVRF